jgi:hypothetical protein
MLKRLNEPLSPVLLDIQLAQLRASIDALTRDLSAKHGENNEPVQRAEQLSAAIQRLEWALARQQPRTRSAAAGA